MSAGELQTDAGLLELVDVDLDFEHDPQCEGTVNGAPCAELAVWLGVLQCCGYSRYSCKPHKMATDELLERPGRCGACLRIVGCARWEPIR